MGGRVTIVVDSREQLPYEFPPRLVSLEKRALPAGDYSLAGMEHAITIERKTLEDFVHSIIRDRDRFRRELVKLATYDQACVVVEAGLDDILSGAYHSGAHPNSILGAAISIIVDYGVPVFFCSDRQCARRFVQEYLLRYHRRVPMISGKATDSCHQQQSKTPNCVERSSEYSSRPPASRPDGS